MADIIPGDSVRKLRACMLCSLVKSHHQFLSTGCENCEPILSLQGNQDRIQDCTSPNFEGLLGLLRPERSWVARWQRVDKFVPGVYAVQVMGSLSQEVQEELLDKGIKYRPRDGTVKD